MFISLVRKIASVGKMTASFSQMRSFQVNFFLLMLRSSFPHEFSLTG